MAVGPVRPGDLLLVHAGAAIAVLEEAGAGA
jgi:hydrogenase maturation factor